MSSIPLTSEQALLNLQAVAKHFGLAYSDSTDLPLLQQTYWNEISKRSIDVFGEIPLGVHYNLPTAHALVRSHFWHSPPVLLSNFPEQGRRQVVQAQNLVRSFSEDVYRSLSIVGMSVHYLSYVTCGFKSGSDFRLPGFLFLTVSDTDNPLDIAEGLVHETMHNLLFFEEMANGMFGDYEFESAEEIFVTSTIRGTKRRFDFAFHGLAVAAILLKFRSSLNRDYTSLGRSIQASLDEIRHILHSSSERGKPVLSPWGCRILTEIEHLAC